MKEPIYIHRWLLKRKVLLQLSISRDGGWYDSLHSENSIEQHHVISFCKSILNQGKNKGYRFIIGPFQIMIGW